MPGNRDPLLSPLPTISGMAVIAYRIIVKFIRYEELCQIADYFGSRSDFYNITQKPVGLYVCLLGFWISAIIMEVNTEPLRSQTKLRSLELEIGKLAAGNLMDVDVRIRTLKIGLKA